MKSSRVSLLAIALVGSLMGGCSAIIGDRVDPGNVALLVDNYGGEATRGVENAQLFTGGRVTYNSVTQTLYEFPVFFQTLNFEGDQTIPFSLSGSRATVDLGVTYRFRTDAVSGDRPNYTFVHSFFQKYRVAPEVFSATTLRNGLRDCANEAVAGSNPVEFASAPTRFQEPLTNCLTEMFPEIELKEVSLLSPPVLPEAIQASINNAFQARQDAEVANARRQQAEAEAAANRAKAEGDAAVEVIRAQARAEANRLEAASITPELVRLRQTENDRIRAEKGLYSQPGMTVQAGNVQIPAPSVSQPAE